ncbi:MAG: ferrous iron transporter B [Candidatus Omnitrophica bacterium]|nr:ferrous iron transporter B [Candidatus Omnitrophota bacterium]
MKKILLMGNPNVGKSAIFSRLTGARVVISNYPGTTVEFTQGKMKVGEEIFMVIDAPGTYTLEPTSKAEEIAVEMLKGGDTVINVVDATNLERNLYLTLQLLEREIPIVVALNMWDDTKHRGIEIDISRLEEMLGVPVVPTCGLTGEGIKKLISRVSEAKIPKFKFSSDKERWETVGKIISSVQKITHRHHSFLDNLEDFSIKPLTGIPLSFGVIYVTFWIIRFLSEGLIRYLFDPIFQNFWLPLMNKLSIFLKEGNFLHTVLIGNLVEGKISFGSSLGVLTTALYVPLAMVLPYILSFYLLLGLWEDFGYLPRLAVLVDNLMHRIGLHGYAIVSFILGLGCNVPGALAIRLLEGRREKFIAATLMAIAVPCMAQIAMIIGLVGKRGGEYVVLIFAILFLLLIIKGLILNKFLKGTSPELLLEIPPYRIPQTKAVVKKLWMRIFIFIHEAVPLVLLGIFFINLLYAFKIIEFLAKLFSPLLIGLWGVPKETISALLVGFLRKDVAVGMLAPLNLTTKELVISSTVLAVYFPCIATFFVLVRELGIKDTLKATLIMLSTALFLGTILNFFLPN